MTAQADLLVVIATCVAVLSLASIVSAWTIRRWPFVAMISFAIAMGLLGYVHLSLTDGLHPLDIPDAFISVAARVLN